MENIDQHTEEYHEPIILEHVRMDRKVVKNGVIEIPMKIDKSNIPEDIKAALDDVTDEGVYCRISIERRVRREEGEAPVDPDQRDMFDRDGEQPPEDKSLDKDDDY